MTRLSQLAAWLGPRTILRQAIGVAWIAIACPACPRFFSLPVAPREPTHASASHLAASSETAALKAAGSVGDWRFDGSDGKTVQDRSANGTNGEILLGEIRREKSRISLELDGLDAYVLIRRRHRLGFANAMTATFWVKAAELRNNTVLFGVPHDNESWTTPVYGMYVDRERVVYGMWLNKGASKVLVESPAELPLDTWTFLAGTYDGASARLYVNGSSAAEKPARGSIADNEQPLLIGKGLGVKKPPLRGCVGELRLYDRCTAGRRDPIFVRENQIGRRPRRAAEKNLVDGTVVVETHGNSPGERPWRRESTRLLELLDGYKPLGDRLQRDRFGGRMDLPPEKSSGFFRVTKFDGRHWLIDPEGRRCFRHCDERGSRTAEGRCELQFGRQVGGNSDRAASRPRFQRFGQQSIETADRDSGSIGMGLAEGFHVRLRPSEEAHCARRRDAGFHR